LPKTRTEWWKEKIEKTKINDLLNHMQLIEMGYKVLIVWECDIKNKVIFSKIINEIR